MSSPRVIQSVTWQSSSWRIGKMSSLLPLFFVMDEVAEYLGSLCAPSSTQLPCRIWLPFSLHQHKQADIKYSLSPWNTLRHMHHYWKEVATNMGRHTFSPWATNAGKNNRRISIFHSTGGALCLSLCRSFLWILYTFIGLALGLGFGLVLDLRLVLHDKTPL